MHSRIFPGKKTDAGLRPLFFLVFVFMITVCLAGNGRAEDGVRALNACGILNRPASVDPIGKSEGFSAVLYNNENGLPTSEANTIAQTSDGFIWIGSYSGLVRYDGNTFEMMYSTSGIANVRCLYVDSRDRLWIGSNDNGVFLLEQGNLQNWDKKDGLKSNSIRAVAEDGENLIYFAGAPGIAVVDAELNFTLLEDERIGEQMIQTLRTGSDGLVYGLAQNGDLFTLKGGKIQFFLDHEECRVKKVLCVYPDPANPGEVYLGTESSKIYYGNLERNFATLGIKGIGSLTYVNNMEYVNGQVWVCAGNGIGRLDEDGFHTLRNVPLNSSVHHVMTDFEGNLWFASSSQGIMKIVPNQFTDLFGQYDLSREVVNSTCMIGRRLFIATDTGLIAVENGKRVTEIPVTKAVTASGTDLGSIDLLKFLDGARIRSLIRDSRDRLWISTWRKVGLICYDHGEITVYTQDDGFFSDRVRTVLETEDGSILVANHGGVSVIQDGRIVRSYGEEDGIAVAEILTIAEADNHDLMLGSDGGGIYVITPDGTRHIGREEGLGSDVVMRIRRSTTQDVYWIIASNSLGYMTQDYQVTTIREFPYLNNYDIYENSQGEVWILSGMGVYVVSAEELLENGKIEPVFYGIHSGLPYVPTANSFSELAADGNLYIASTAGVAKINIESPLKSSTELRAALPYLEADGKLYYPDEDGKFTLPAGIRKLTVTPRVFSYSLVDPQVSYRLEGFDRTETTVIRKDLDPVEYTNLPNANYQFVIRTKDPISRTETQVSFRIVKGGESSTGADGTIIMDVATLFFLCGILIYSSLYRKRGRPDDRLFFSMILVDMIMAAAELISYLMEGSSVAFMRELMYTLNTVYYAGVALFAYLYLLVLEFHLFPDRARFRKMELLYGIPLALFILLLLVNLWTGWIFSITAENMYVSGPVDQLIFVPMLLYFLIAAFRSYRMGLRVLILEILLILARILGDVWYVGISSTAFVYMLFLVCIHIFAINQPVKNEEAP